MLAIQLNQHTLDLSGDEALNLTLQNPAFDLEAAGRAYAYPFRIPHSPTNTHAIDHQHRIDTKTLKKYQPAKVRLAGNEFVTGRALIEEHTDRNSEITFQNNDLVTISDLDEIDIHDLLGTITIAQTQKGFIALTPGAGPIYRVGVNGTLYQGGGLGVDKIDAMIELVGEINADNPSTAFYSQVADELQFTFEDENFIVSAIEVNNWTVAAERQLSEARENNLQTYIDNIIVLPHEAIAFPVVYNTILYGQKNRKYRNYINWRHNGNYIDNQHYVGEQVWEVTYIPFVRLRYLLDLIATAAGLDDILFDLSAEETAAMEKILLYNNYPLDRIYTESVLTDNLGTAFRNGFVTEIDLKNHVPDYTAKELLERIAGGFNLHFRWKNNTLYLVKNTSQLTDQLKDWTTLTSPPYERTTVESNGVTLSFDPTPDEQIDHQQADYSVGDGSNSVVLPFRPLYYRTIFNFFDDDRSDWKIVAIDQKGSSPAYEQETELETMRLLFDHGQQEDEDGDTYWYGSPDNLTYDDTSIAAFSLDFTGTPGLFATFWKGWTRVMFSPVLTRVCRLSIAQLLRIRNWQEIFIYIYHPQGEAKAIIRRVQLKISTRGIAQAQVEFQQYV